MSFDPIDIVGTPGNRDTQGLGRLAGQYVRSERLIVLLRGLYELGQDMQLLWSKIGRILDPNDDASQAASNTDGAKTFQLLGIGNLVGVTNVVPGASGPITLTDAQFLKLILARIYRNHVRGGTIPQFIEAIQIVMPDLTTDAMLHVEELGVRVSSGATGLTVMVIVGREVVAWETGIFAITSGVARTRYAVLPKPDGVSLLCWWWNEGCFTFALEDDPTTLVDEDGVGFNTSESITEGIGHWPEDF
jgi:hypothetical protein